MVYKNVQCTKVAQKREIQSLGHTFDWNDLSDVEFVDLDEPESGGEEEVIDFDESSRDMKEELDKALYIVSLLKAVRICSCFYDEDMGVNIEKLRRDNKSNRKMKRKTKKIDRMRFRPRTRMYFFR
ncbi:hypothetical protein PS15p_212300 [Mucor circinelloides]